MNRLMIDELPKAPTNQPSSIKCSCGKWDFMGIDNETMRQEIALHLELSRSHGKVY